jgi:hypothetical protein
MTTNDGTVGRYLGWFLVALSLGAGVIHFAESGGHFDVSWAHGAFFAVVAWLQLSWAAAVVVRPTRRLLAAAAIGNTAVIVTWAVSRVWGVPVGPDSWTAEPVALADALATGFEAAIVLTCLAVLARPALAQRTIRPALGFGGLGLTALAVAVVSTMALSPSFASDHHGGGHGHGGSEEATGGGHGSGGHAVGGGHAAGESAGHAEGHTNAMISADGTSACEQAGVANEGNSGHGHRGPVPHAPMDAATQEEYRAQVAEGYAAAASFPTVADAEAAGYRRITPYIPCIAAHYIKGSAMRNPFDPGEPEILLYAGTDPDSEIVGLSYLQFADADRAPEGFAGDLDPWHVHSQLCIGGEDGSVLGDESTTPEDCERVGGRVVPLDNLWMSHMWPVPGWESRWGLFSSEHPDLGGRIGDINGEPRREDD